MSATDLVENAVLRLIFLGTTWADIAENDSTSPATSFWLSAYTSDPGELGDQTTGETAYTDYARVEMTRNTSGWTVSNDTVQNAAAIAFPVCGGSPGDPIRYIGIGKDQTGAGELLFVVPLESAFTMDTGVQPYFAAGEVVITCD